MAEPRGVARYLLIYVLAGTLCVAGLLGGVYYLTNRPSHDDQVPVLYTNLTVAPRNTSGHVPGGFFGINLRAEYPPATSPGSALNATPIDFVRWPGGAIAERLDVFTGAIYADDGTTSPAASNLSQFVSWCELEHCQAILQLPTEIDNTSLAVQEVEFVRSLPGGPFEPAYWELGNEPATWTHFGVPWTGWNSTQNDSVDASEYAKVVGAYIYAIHQVDGKARFLGLGGLGTGVSGETSWLSTLARVDGASLSGYSLHVYPAGGNITGTPTPAGFFATLNDSASIPARLPSDRAAIQIACRGCNDTILVDELGSGTGGDAYDTIMGGYDEVPYIAAELIQAVGANVSSTELFAYESSYPGSFVNATTGSSNPIELLYDDFLQGFPTRLESASVNVPVRGLFELAGGNPDGSNMSVLVVNTNPNTVALNWSLAYGPLPGGSDGSLRWAPGEPAPVTFNSTVPAFLQVQIPSGGIWLWQEGPGLALSGEFPRTGSSSLTREMSGGADGAGPGVQPGVLTATRVSVPLIPGTRRTRCSTMLRASLTCPA